MFIEDGAISERKEVGSGAAKVVFSLAKRGCEAEEMGIFSRDSFDDEADQTLGRK